MARIAEPGALRLRAVEPSDLDHLFEQGRDPEANAMAAFGPANPDDRAAFDAHWRRILDDPTVVVDRDIRSTSGALVDELILRLAG